MEILNNVKKFLETQDIIELIDELKYKEVIKYALFDSYSYYGIDFDNDEFINLRNVLQLLGYDSEKDIIDLIMESIHIVAPDIKKEYVSVEYLLAMLTPAFPCGISEDKWDNELKEFMQVNPNFFNAYILNNRLQIKYIGD